MAKYPASLVLAGLLASGCTLLMGPDVDGPSETPNEEMARMIATEFLMLASDSASADRGWSLLHPDLQEDMFNGDASAWIDAASAMDWSSFRWSIDEIVPDDPLLYFVYLTIEDWESTPRILTDARNHLTLLTGMNLRERPHLAVRLAPGGQGIWGVGG